MGFYAWEVSEAEKSAATDAAAKAATAVRPTDCAVSANDLRQTAVLAVLGEMAKERNRPVHVESWAYRVGRNACLREVRSNRIRSGASHDASVIPCDRDAAVEAEDRRRRACLTRQLTGLPQRDFDAVSARYRLDASHDLDCVAEKWQVTPTRVRQLAQATVERLANVCQEDTECE